MVDFKAIKHPKELKIFRVLKTLPGNYSCTPQDFRIVAPKRIKEAPRF
jgi:hypothetical protein